MTITREADYAIRIVKYLADIDKKADAARISEDVAVRSGSP
jgi:DNA-binding IscR family transcriptional regulator